MAYITQYTRLALSDKLPDRFLAAQVYKPIEPEQVEAGMIFSQIEILNPWFPTSQIGQTIINTLIREYYKGRDTSELVNFELALRRVNEALAQVAQGGETDWIGNINGVLCLVNGRDIHISQTGRSQAYLFRGRKINHITEGLSPEAEPHPLKTFGNITSGTLQLHDKVLIGSPTLFDHIPLDTLRNIVEDVPPTIALMEVAQLLRREKAFDANAILVELTTKEEAANLPLEQKLETVYLDQTVSSFRKTLTEIFNKYGRPVLAFSVATGKASWKTANHHLKKSVLPYLTKAQAKIGHTSDVGFTKLRLQTNILKAKLKQRLQERHLKAESEKNLIDRAASKTLVASQFVKRGFGPVGGLFQKLSETIRNFLGIGQPDPSQFRARRWGTAIICLFLLLVMLVGVKGLRGRYGVDRKEAEAGIQNLTEILEEAQLAADFNEEAQAIALFQQVIEEAERLLAQNPPQEEKVQALREKAETGFNRLTLSRSLQGEVIADLEGVKSMTLGKESLFVATKDSILKIDPETQEQSVLTELDEENQPKFIDFQTKSGKIFIYTENQTVLELDTESGDSTEIDEPAVFASANCFLTYLTNLYLLSSEGDQIFKYTKTETGFKESAFIPEGSAQGAVDFAIDGNIYLLFPDGRIGIASKTKIETLESTEPPFLPLLTEPSLMFTTKEADSLYLFDKKGIGGKPRIVVLDKNGRYRESLVLNKELKEAESLRINPETRALLLLSGGKVYQTKF